MRHRYLLDFEPAVKDEYDLEAILAAAESRPMDAALREAIESIESNRWIEVDPGSVVRFGPSEDQEGGDE